MVAIQLSHGAVHASAANENTEGQPGYERENHEKCSVGRFHLHPRCVKYTSQKAMVKCQSIVNVTSGQRHLGYSRAVNHAAMIGPTACAHGITLNGLSIFHIPAKA